MPDSKNSPAPGATLSPPVQSAAPVPERQQEELREIALVDVSVPPRSPAAHALAASPPSLNDVIKYWHLVSEVLHAIQTEQGTVKFRFTAPNGKKKNMTVSISDA